MTKINEILARTAAALACMFTIAISPAYAEDDDIDMECMRASLNRLAPPLRPPLVARAAPPRLLACPA